MNLKKGWTEDETGLCYTSPSGRKSRGRWAACLVCSEWFPAVVSNPGKYCSKQCLGRAKGGANRNSRLDLFVHWTPEECWLAGLLWADGHLSVNGTKSAVQLNLTDEEAAAHAARIIGCRYHTHEQRWNHDGYERKPVHRLQFGARDAVGRFAAIGFDKPKLTTRPFPALPYSAAFLRGLFDADGSVTWHRQGGRKRSANAALRLHSELSGGVPVLEGAQTFLADHGIAPKKIGRNGSVWKVQWNHHDSLQLAAVLYADAGPCIARKRETFTGPQIQQSDQ